MNEFIKISVPKIVYHYTTKADAESIIADGKIYPADGCESWYSLTIDDLKTYIDLTVKNEGQAYIDFDGKIKTYGKFVPENYVILELKPRYSDHWYRYISLLSNSFPLEQRLMLAKMDTVKICHRGIMEFNGKTRIIDMQEIM